MGDKRQLMAAVYSSISKKILTTAAVALITLSTVIIPGLNIATVSADSNCTVSDKLVNSCRPWLGAAVNKYPQVASTDLAQANYHEQRIGRALDIVHTYHAVGSNQLSSDDKTLATRPGTFLFTNWKPAANWGDAGGSNATTNAGIDQMAASVKSLGSQKIFMTINHEPENDVTSDANCPSTSFVGSSGTPDQYKAMWQNVENRFKADGANNVVWVLDLMNYAPWDCVVNDLYPGNNLVDWVMFNGYGGPKTTNFVTNVSHMYNFLTANSTPDRNYLSKPWGIVEWNIRNATTAQGISYYDQAKAALDNNTFPLLKAYMGFDDVGPDGNENRIEYDNNHVLSPTKQQHYASFANDPAFSGGWSYAPPADTTAPVAAITAPADQATVSGSVNVTGTATDNVNVTDLRLLVDGVDTGLTSATPDNASISWDSNSVAAGSHTLQFQATDAAGNAGLSPAITVTVDNTDHQPPTTPAAVTATAVTASQVDLSWAPSTDNTAVAGYNVLRDGAVVATVQGAAIAAYNDTTVVPQTSYSYQIQAFDGAGNTSAASDPVSVITPSAADTTAPSIPLGVTATAADGHSIDVTWQPSSDDTATTGYHVYRDGVQVANVSTGTSYHDANLADAASYDYRVSAYDAAGNESAQSDPSAVTLPDITAPTTPTGLTATAYSPFQVNLSWQAAEDNVGVAGYHLYRGGNLIATLPAAVMSYADVNLGDASNYSYTLDAFDAVGNVSAATASVTVATSDGTPPSVPTSVTATAPTSQEADLSWQAASDNVGVTGYHIYRDGALVATVAAGANSYQDTALSAGTGYSYTVDAFDGAGNTSAQSTPATVTTPAAPDTQAPSVPAGLSATAASASVVNLAWQSSADNVGVTGYHLYRDGALIANIAATSTAYADTTVSEAHSYSYTVDAFDAAGNVSAISLAALANTPDVTAPGQPTSLTATAASYAQVNLSWHAASDNVGVAGYHVYRNGSLVATLGVVTSYADNAVAGSTAYSYTIDAFDAAGNTSAKSTAAGVTTPTAPDVTPPSVPTGIRATATTTSSITITWTPSSDNRGVTGYNLFRNGVKIKSPAGANYVDTGLSQGTSYVYTVQAFDAAGNKSATSAGVTLATQADTIAPSVPTKVTPTVTASYLVTLNWAASTDTGGSGLAKYIIYRSDLDSTPLATVGPTTTSYADTLVKAGTAYTYQIVAVDGRGNQSAKSTGVKATTAAAKEKTAPTTPSSLKATSIGSTSVTLSWKASTDNTGVKGYHIYRNGIYVGDSTTASYTDRSASAGTTYKYTVVAYDASANVSGASAALSLTTSR